MKDGWPLSYRHFIYGTRHLARHRARESLRTAGVRLSTATGMGTTPAADSRAWLARMTRQAGW